MIDNIYDRKTFRAMIRKWEIICDKKLTDGNVYNEDTGNLSTQFPQYIRTIMNRMYANCYLCQLHLKERASCDKCPLALGYEQTPYPVCCEPDHPWSKWFDTGKVEYAKEVLDILKKSYKMIWEEEYVLGKRKKGSN